MQVAVEIRVAGVVVGFSKVRDLSARRVVRVVEFAARLSAARPLPQVLGRQAEILLLLVLGLPTAYIDWRIAAIWSWPVGWRILWLGLAASFVAVAGLRLQWREGLAALTVALLYAVPVVGAIVRWHLHPGPTALIGDGALQTQLAGQLLLRGIDPYGADYTVLGLGRAPWNEPFPNPALHHTVFWPGQFLLPLPVQAVCQSLLGWWDQRIFLLGVAVGIWFLLRKLLPGLPGRLAAIGFFLIPGHSLLAVLGDNDLPMLAVLLAALLAAHSRRFLMMGVLLGLAVATKQHAAVAAPFVLIWAVARRAGPAELARAVGLAMIAALAVVLPFAAWDPRAFFTDTVLFVSGSGIDAYPINGFGLSSMLLTAGLIHGPRDPFPFAAFEGAFALTFWLLGGRWISRQRQLAGVLLWSGFALLLVLYVSRYFHDTHLLLGSELILAGLLGVQRVEA